MKTEFIDLGLPSGTLWASYNIGANSPEEFGDYKTFEEAKELSAPTREQFEELYNNCTWEWCKVNGVKGYKVTGSNGNSIFLPYAGFRIGGSLYIAGVNGYYWSSSLNTGAPYLAYSLSFYSGGVTPSYSFDRYNGFSVRPVRNANTIKDVTTDNSLINADVNELKITKENFGKFIKDFSYSMACATTRYIATDTPEGEEWLWNKLKEEFKQRIKKI